MFLKLYRVANLFNDLTSIYLSGYRVENLFNFMSGYFSAEGVYYELFGKKFKEKFPVEYNEIIQEMNKLK